MRREVECQVLGLDTCPRYIKIANHIEFDHLVFVYAGASFS